MKNSLKISLFIVTVSLTGIMAFVIVSGVTPPAEFGSAFLLAFGAMIGKLYGSSDRKNNNVADATEATDVAKEE